ncbi:MAG: B12-binding domain-containing radical SAM protein [Planctomycetota bacterium]
MELPSRQSGDELLRPGQMLQLRKRLRSLSRKEDLATVMACAFDHRTRMLPFIYADVWMAPAGPRAIGAAMADAGFAKTRVVLQQWNRNFRPSQMKLDGRVPDVFMVSSLQLHLEQCRALIRDACRIDAPNRPLIIAGGPLVIYEPWEVFGADRNDPWAADAAVTGEEYVLLSLLEALLSIRGRNETLRSCFIRARDAGMLEHIPGLVYALGRRDGVAEELVNTGIQRLLGDLDELPSPALGYRLLEPPSSKPTLASRPLPPGRVRRYSPIAALLLTAGCRFACNYCPIPAYNQRQHRLKSPPRAAEEMQQLHAEYGMRFFSGLGGNFFNNHAHALDVFETLAVTRIDGKRHREVINWGTEVTVHDTLKMKDHLPLMGEAGIHALWLGVEDITGTLVKKGQTVESTLEAFGLMRSSGISPMPMIMHHDPQPLITRSSAYGLLNQVRLLRKAGAIDLQVLILTPAVGAKNYEEAYAAGSVFESVAGKPVEAHHFGGSYVIASRHKGPWKKQLNLMAAYLYFYNPLRLLWALVRPKGRMYLADAASQVIGMWGLAKTIRRTTGWALRLMFGKVKRTTSPPVSHIPTRGVRSPSDRAVARESSGAGAAGRKGCNRLAR